jgi:hypothetical protein
MEANLDLHKMPDPEILTPKQQHKLETYPYRQVVGSVLYLSIYTRPDITYTVGKLAQFNAKPTLAAINACNHLLQYIKSTLELGLRYYGQKAPALNAYCDASFSDCNYTGKSTTGFIIYLGTCPIFWNSHLGETGVSISTADAEYSAVSSCARQTMACRNLANEIKLIDTSKPIIIYEDNKACIAIALQTSSKPRNKYMITKIHYVREAIATGYLELTKIDTQIQTADSLTKPLTKNLFLRHRPYLLGARIGQYENEYHNSDN